MTVQRKNSYEEDDLAAVVSQIEEREAAIKSIMAKAMNDAKQERKKIADLKKEAKDSLGIPLGPLGALLKTRKLEREIAAIAEGVADDLVEVFEDMTGQLSFLAPTDGAKSPSQVAAKRRSTAAEENEAREQQEGGELIDAMTQH